MYIAQEIGKVNKYNGKRVYVVILPVITPLRGFHSMCGCENEGSRVIDLYSKISFSLPSHLNVCLCMFERRKQPVLNNLWLAFNHMPSKHQGLHCLLVIRQKRVNVCGIALFRQDSFRPRLICLPFNTFSPFLLRMTRFTSDCHCAEFFPASFTLHFPSWLQAHLYFLFFYAYGEAGIFRLCVFCHDITVKLSIWPEC